MNSRKIDTDFVRKSVAQLRKLKKDCEQQSNTNMPSFAEDEGRMHDELLEACQILKDEWSSMISLIDNTISFMSGGVEAIDQADQEDASGFSEK